MRKLNLLLLLFSFVASFAQDEQAIQKEIDSTLWKPFKAAFETLEATNLNKLYAEDVLRVTPNGIDTENKFKLSNISHFEENIASETTIQLDFWFDSRKSNASTSYEVGFYRMRLTNLKASNTIYGQFHIVLQKIDGKWKITQDWDTTSINGNAINAQDFEKQIPLQFDRK